MKTIEERAKAYAAKCHCQNTEWGFIAGAQSEHEELTRWLDPKEELPPQGKMVLLKVTFGCHYQLAERGDECWWSPMDDEWGIPDSRVIGWREIHENIKASNESK